MHAMYVTQRHEFGGWGRATTVNDSPSLLLRVWPLCGASWDVSSRTCARSVSAVTPLLKSGEEKDNKYTMKRIHFTSTAFHQHSPLGERLVGGGDVWLRAPPSAPYIHLFLPLMPPSSLSPWCCPCMEAFGHGWRGGFRKEAPFNLA